MALNNGGLEDAGREYYDKQFGARIGDIRKPGAAPRPTASGGNGKKAGGAIGGVVVAVFVLIKIFAACGGSSNYHSTYTPSYNYTPPPQPVFIPPPQPVFNPPPARPLVLPPGPVRDGNDPVFKPGVPRDDPPNNRKARGPEDDDLGDPIFAPDKPNKPEFGGVPRNDP